MNFDSDTTCTQELVQSGAGCDGQVVMGSCKNFLQRCCDHSCEVRIALVPAVSQRTTHVLIIGIARESAQSTWEVVTRKIASLVAD